MNKLLTIGMATYDDFDGVYFSLQSLRMHQEILNKEDVEYIVVDNNPDGKHGKEVKKLVENWVKGKYIPYKYKTSTAVRNEIFRNASGKYCISMDCHVLFWPNAISSLLKYYEDNPDCRDIVHGPLVYDNLTSLSTHFKPIWGSGMYGKWETDHESLKLGKPFEIPMQGLGVFSCETKNWLGFNKHFKGFGGEEGYIHEKFRQCGGKAICVPGFKWVHRFARPDGVKYPLCWEDRVWNYFIGWLELTQDPGHEMINGAYNHFVKEVGVPQKNVDNLLKQAISQIII